MIKLDGKGPLYQQLTKSLRQAIVDGLYQAGEKLPSSRALAKTLQISRNVVISSYEQLNAEGYLQSKIGAGSFVTKAKLYQAKVLRKSPSTAPVLSKTADQSLAHWQKYRLNRRSALELDVDFQYGPVEVNKAVLEDIGRITRRCRNILQSDYQHPAGLKKLREAIVRYVQLNRGCVCHPDQVVITNGSQQALDLIARLLLNVGDKVLIEDPCYRGARQAFSTAGGELIPCRVDEDGIDPACFPASNKASPIKLVYTTPSHQFPTGVVLSQPRRLALLAWATRNEAYIIEDDYDSEFRYTGQPIEAIQGLDQMGRTIYVGTFSKMLSSSLRIGYMVLPEPLIEPMMSLKWCSDRCGPLLTQSVMAEFLDSPMFARHLKRMRNCYAERRDALLSSLDEKLGDQISVQGTNAGIHLLAWLNNTPLEEEHNLLARAHRNRLGIYTVNSLYAQSPKHIGLLMGYAHLSVSDIYIGINKLSSLIKCK
jgi:GntR family transcriptional regulator/MocR family aminotransferase